MCFWGPYPCRTLEVVLICTMSPLVVPVSRNVSSREGTRHLLTRFINPRSQSLGCIFLFSRSSSHTRRVWSPTVKKTLSFLSAECYCVGTARSLHCCWSSAYTVQSIKMYDNIIDEITPKGGGRYSYANEQVWAVILGEFQKPCSIKPAYL